MNKQQVKARDEENNPFAPIFEWTADRTPPPDRQEIFLLQDDACKAYEVDMSQFFGDLEDIYKLHPGIDATRIWTVHEVDDHQYWISGTSSYVNQMGYYVSAKPVPSNLRIMTSSQCVYCDNEECECERCPVCDGLLAHHMETDFKPCPPRPKRAERLKEFIEKFSNISADEDEVFDIQDLVRDCFMDVMYDGNSFYRLVEQYADNPDGLLKAMEDLGDPEDLWETFGDSDKYSGQIARCFEMLKTNRPVYASNVTKEDKTLLAERLLDNEHLCFVDRNGQVLRFNFDEDGYRGYCRSPIEGFRESAS